MSTRTSKARPGPKPKTTNSAPHAQLEQHGPKALVERLIEWSFSLPDIEEEPSRISVPGARALVLAKGMPGNQDAFMVGREFAHIHPQPDFGSLHLKLAPRDAQDIVKRGWGEHHPMVLQGYQPPGAVMVYCPRDEEELGVVKDIVSMSREYAMARKVPE